VRDRTFICVSTCQLRFHFHDGQSSVNSFNVRRRNEQWPTYTIDAIAVEFAKDMVSAEMPEREDVAEVMDVPETKCICRSSYIPCSRLQTNFRCPDARDR
jgi:hypothetical protein